MPQILWNYDSDCLVLWIFNDEKYAKIWIFGGCKPFSQKACGTTKHGLQVHCGYFQVCVNNGPDEPNFRGPFDLEYGKMTIK